MIVKEAKGIRYDEDVLKLFKDNKKITVKEIVDEAEDFKFWNEMMIKAGMSAEEINNIFATSMSADDVAEKVYNAIGNSDEYKLAFAESVSSPIMLEDDSNLSLDEVKRKVRAFIRDMIDSEIEDNLSRVVNASIQGYDPEWCEMDGSTMASMEASGAKDEYIDATMNVLFANAPESVKESVEENDTVSDVVLVIYDDETERNEYYNDREADAHIEELKEMTDEDLDAQGILGYARLTRDEDGKFIRVRDDDYVADSINENIVREQIQHWLAQYNSKNESVKDDKKNILVETNSMLKKAYDGSYYTIVGAGGDINEWKQGYQDLLDKEGIGKIKEWIEFTGDDMNKEFQLTGDNAYEPDLHFLAFSLDGLNLSKLAIFKIRMQDRWFNDIVDNNASRQGFNPYTSETFDDSDDDLDECLNKNLKVKKAKECLESYDSKSYGVKAWFNLKGTYDIFVFSDKASAESFANDWNKAYEEVTTKLADCEDDEKCVTDLTNALDSIINKANTIDEYEGVFNSQINKEDGKETFKDIEIVGSVEYGV